MKAELQTTTIDNGPIDRAFSFVASLFEKLGDIVTNGNVVKNQKLIGGDTKVPHGLGRAVTSWEIIRKNSNVNVWESAVVNPSPRQFIILSSTGASTVDLRFG